MRDMLGREDAVSVAEAQRRIADHLVIKIPPVVQCDISDSYERVLAEDISSPEEMPAFARSTVDGFAVRASDTFGATEGLPAYLTVTHEIFMGKAADFSLKKGSVAKIPTGGMLPEGADAVIMFEHTQSADETTVEILKPVAPMENVISAGEDVRKGELILKRGSKLRPQDVAALAGVGITRVAVYEKPRVAIISTGDEIVPSGHPLKLGQVRDINSFNLAGLIKAHGGVPVKKGIFRDVYEVIGDVLVQSLKEAEIVIITGGSSVGTMDMTAKVIQSIGTPGVLFHGVTLKPGKPTMGGVVQGIPVFGLPGHPAAVTVCFELFIAPVLRRLTGVIEKEHIKKKRTLNARIAKNVSSGAGREEHIRVALEEREGELWAVPVLGKSGLIRTFVLADGTIIIPAQVRGIQEGEMVEVVLF
jgi:molybdopterin molybdotransferase